MTARFCSRIDAEGLLNVAITELTDAEMTAYFDANPGARDLVGVPVYWSEMYGYWPKPDTGWKCYP